jgi:hypothetical protein
MVPFHKSNFPLLYLWLEVKQKSNPNPLSLIRIGKEDIRAFVDERFVQL